MSRKLAVIGCLLLLVILVVALGYAPFMRYWFTRQMDTAPTVEERVGAAESLYQRHEPQSFDIFAERLASADLRTRTAAIVGMVRIGSEGGSAGAHAIPKLAERLQQAQSDEERNRFVIALSKTVHAWTDDLEKERQNVSTIAELLESVASTPTADKASRADAAKALADLRWPGVCRTLLKVAAEDPDKEIKAQARHSLAATALPDAAGDLLKAWTGPDTELAAAAKDAFARVRDETPSAALVPLATDPNDDVRREIVAALAKRRNDPKAAEAMSLALKDKLPQLRKQAVQAVLTTGLSGPASQLAALAADADEDVRVATAETLGQMRDDDSRQIVLEVFKNELSGKTLDAFLLTLGRRVGGKDLKAIGTVLDILKKNPASEPTVREALVLLTSNGQGARRETERRGWDAAKWNAWYARLCERERLKDQALEMLQAADQRKQGDKKYYPELLRMTRQGIDTLEKCKEMCKPDDPEDAAFFDQKERKYMLNQELFFKHQVIDARQ